MSDDTDYVTATRSLLRERLQEMDPERFEHFVADVWERLGWETRVVGEPGDRGIDVIATATTDAGPQKQLIQAKRYGPNTTVGSPEVQQYASLRLQEEHVDQVTIVTTGDFSAQAEEMAPDLDVILIRRRRFQYTEAPARPRRAGPLTSTPLERIFKGFSQRRLERTFVTIATGAVGESDIDALGMPLHGEPAVETLEADNRYVIAVEPEVLDEMMNLLRG